MKLKETLEEKNEKERIDEGKVDSLTRNINYILTQQMEQEEERKKDKIKMENTIYEEI